jgi:hypothetical protein
MIPYSTPLIYKIIANWFFKKSTFVQKVNLQSNPVNEIVQSLKIHDGSQVLLWREVLTIIHIADLHKNN